MVDQSEFTFFLNQALAKIANPTIKKNKYIKTERKIMNMKNIKFEKQKINKTEIEDKEYLNLYFRNINALILKKHKLARKNFK